MKKIIVILLMTIVNSMANYVSSGSADTKGEAYVQAMSNAPSGNHWILSSVNYRRGHLGRYVCTVVWKQK
jgi:L-cysteine desulfidase